MEFATMNVQQSPASFEFNMAPIMKMYVDSMEAWKKNYETLAGNGTHSAPSYSTDVTKTAYDSALTNWQKSGEEVFKRFVEQQIDICRFFAGRWEQYLKLPDQLAHCHTPAEIGQVQAAFLSQFASEYMHESSKLAQPMGQLMSQWALPRA
ncbi:MAG: hypothetical protein ACLPWS_02075 [Rhodomicrobium sp.]